MGLFRKKTILAGDTDASSAADSIAVLRASLSEGAAQQELAAQKLAGLSEAISRLDASRREAARLSSDVERLTRDLRESEAKFDAKAAWASEQSAKYTAVKSERDQLRRRLAAAQDDVAKAREALDAQFAENAHKATELDAVRARLSSETERADLAELAKAKLSETDAKRSAAYKAQSVKLAELTRSVEDQSARLADKTGAAEAATAALRDLRSEHAATKEKLIEALNALQASEYQMTSQDSAHTDALARRSDEITTLRRQVEQLSAELRIKKGMGEHYDRDLIALRAELQTTRDLASAAEARLRDSTETEGRQAGALAQAKIDYDALAEKFSDALRDIEALRKVNLMQRKTLERYAEVGGSAAPRSHTSPEPVRPVRVVGGTNA